jgi:hypothetical protein
MTFDVSKSNVVKIILTLRTLRAIELDINGVAIGALAGNIAVD